MTEIGPDHTFTEDGLARIERDLRCDAAAPGDLDAFCTRRLGHEGPHMTVTLDGDSVEWRRES